MSKKAGPSCTGKYLVLLVASLIVLGSWSTASAQTTLADQACIKEATGLNNPACTANDVRVASLRKISGDACTQVGDTVTVRLEATIESGPQRFDVAVWVNQEGNSAKTDPTGNNCTRTILRPIADAPGCDQLGGPYIDLDNDTCGDVYASGTNPCSNAVTAPCTSGGGTCLITTIEFDVDILCVDTDNNNLVDVGTCTSWDNNDSTACNSVADAKPGTGSKCSCSRIDVVGLCIESECTAQNTACSTFACNPNFGDPGEPQCIQTFLTATTICRASTGQCDVAESCDGVSEDCPADGKAPATTTCTGTSNGGLCDGTDSCDGAGNCVDGFLTSTTICRASTGQCDVAESCTGSSGACPADGFQPATTACTGTSNGGACDGTDSCDGAGNCVDGFLTATTICRASTGECDPAESCTGSSGACPADEGTQCLPGEPQITPTGTTCQQFRDGTAADLTTVQYSRTAGGTGVIHQVNPGVFFLYATLPLTPGSVITITQDNGIWIDSEVLLPQGTQVILYNATTCAIVRNFSSSGGATGLSINTTTGTVTITDVNVPAGNYILSIKYETGGVLGCNTTDCDDPGTTFTFHVDVGGIPTTTNPSVDFVEK